MLGGIIFFSSAVIFRSSASFAASWSDCSTIRWRFAPMVSTWSLAFSRTARFAFLVSSDSLLV